MVAIPAVSFATSYHRGFPRKRLDIFGKFLDYDATPLKVRIADISRGGVGLLMDAPAMSGTPCAISFDVDVDGTLKRVNVWAKIIYCSIQQNDLCRVGARIRDCDAQSRAIIDQLSTGFPICGY